MPTKNVLEYLESAADRTPEKTAFEDMEKSYSYAELKDRAMRIGSYLQKEIGSHEAVAVFMDKSVEAIATMMGVVYAGCFYTLLDIKQPVQRLNQILDILGAKVIITRKTEKENVAIIDLSGKTVFYEEICQTEINERALSDIRAKALDIDPLYTIFTSGSTGVPKGVLVGHRSVIDFIEVFTDLFDITSEDIIGNQAPFDFDVSVKDIYSTLKAGATMEIIPTKLFSVPTKLLDFLCERNVTTIIWAVSALCILTTLKAFRYKVPDKLKKIMFSGEIMPIKHLNEWKRHIPDAMYVNLYGPTEITCNCTYYIVNREFDNDEILPIGVPFPNERVFLLDGDDHLVEGPGNEGEICVSGTALALGYYNNKEQTDAAFTQNPLNKNYIELIYRTGDLGVYTEDGLLMFKSRKDFQIKHMGHRIELSEIDVAMEYVDQVERVCTIYDEACNKIIAFYQGNVNSKAILERLSSLIPSYMIPNRFMQVEGLPLTKNGKIDRRALLEQYQASRNRRSDRIE